ncbi:MAG: class I SAM-dependent methyltransferase [Chloroflexi bacterium]|nr:class I SAM-dependent methyltransferase [Chloroflexota bacterium]
MTTTPTGDSSTAVGRWRSMVEADREQTARVASQQAGGPGQRWSGGRAETFRADPHRVGDPNVDLIASFQRPDQTWLDVGAGAGRLTLPLALNCKHVYAVEAAPPMAAILTEQAAAAEISNVTLIEGRWQDVDAPMADIALCFNVMNFVPDIDLFITKLNQHAHDRVLVVLMKDGPMANVAPFWRLVHGTEPAQPPALAELLAVLWELGFYPDVQMLPPRYRVSKDRETVRMLMADRLGVVPGSPEEGRLELALDELLVPIEGGFAVRGAEWFREALVTWRPQASNTLLTCV